MTFSIIGSGNIAWFLGARLTASNHKCAGVYGRNKESTGLLAEALMAEDTGEVHEIEDGRADVCFLTVSDHAISEVAAHLSFKETVLLHTAGAVPMDAIGKAAPDRGVLWPIYSIVKSNLPDHRNIPCAWEFSTEQAKKHGLEMAKAITDILFEAQYEQRKWLHLSAVISNNFTNHLLAICERICAENGLPFQVLMPIVEQTFERIRTASPAALQTGPAARGDAPTIHSQTGLLSSHPAWQKIYEDITSSIMAHSAD